MAEDNDTVTIEADSPILDVEFLPQDHHRPRSGDLCWECGIGRLDYDGLLNLSCPRCGATASGGCFT